MYAISGNESVLSVPRPCAQHRKTNSVQLMFSSTDYPDFYQLLSFIQYRSMSITASLLSCHTEALQVQNLLH